MGRKSCEIFEDYRIEIERYCAENNIDANKVFSSVHSYNKEQVEIYHYEPATVKESLTVWTIGGPPMPIALKIFLENGKLHFEQTDITHKCLGIRNQVEEMAFA